MLPYHVHLCWCVIKKKAPYRYSQKIYPSLWSILIWFILLWKYNEIELHLNVISFEKLVISVWEKSQKKFKSLIILTPKRFAFPSNLEFPPQLLLCLYHIFCAIVSHVHILSLPYICMYVSVCMYLLAFWHSSPFDWASWKHGLFDLTHCYVPNILSRD